MYDVSDTFYLFIYLFIHANHIMETKTLKPPKLETWNLDRW